MTFVRILISSLLLVACVSAKADTLYGTGASDHSVLMQVNPTTGLVFGAIAANDSAGTGYVLDSIAFAPAVPEPETCAMLIAGLGLLGAISRRRWPMHL